MCFDLPLFLSLSLLLSLSLVNYFIAKCFPQAARVCTKLSAGSATGLPTYVVCALSDRSEVGRTKGGEVCSTSHKWCHGKVTDVASTPKVVTLEQVHAVQLSWITGCINGQF